MLVNCGLNQPTFTHTVAYIIIPYRKYMALDDVNIYYSGNICCVVGCNRFDARQARS